MCVLQQQVPLPLPCFNFAQIAALSLTPKPPKHLRNSVHSDIYNSF
jgi:hypothetical protein